MFVRRRTSYHEPLRRHAAHEAQQQSDLAAEQERFRILVVPHTLSHL
jgi:hypothetical protein